VSTVLYFIEIVILTGFLNDTLYNFETLFVIVAENNKVVLSFGIQDNI